MTEDRTQVTTRGGEGSRVPRNLGLRAAARAALLGPVVALVAAVGPAGAAPGASRPRPVVLLPHIAYYSVNNGSTFCRYTTPQPSVPLTGGGTVSQGRHRHYPVSPVTLSITGATGYADDGFYEPVGVLGHLAGYVLRAKGPFSSNLWFDTDIADDTTANGQFFAWSNGCLSNLGGDVYGLGPTSTPNGALQVETVSGSSTFSLTCNDVYGPVTLSQLEAGFCAGINGSTPVALWVGIDVGSGGSISTKIVRGRTRTD